MNYEARQVDTSRGDLQLHLGVGVADTHHDLRQTGGR